MAIITLTSDYGLRDPFVPALHGALMGSIPDVHIEDISHDIQPFHIAQSAYVISEAFPYFPKNSIHLIAVKEGFSGRVDSLLMRKEGHYFMAPDNGILALIRREIKPQWIFRLNFHNATTLFPARDIFVPAAAHLLKGGEPEVLGQKVTEIESPSNFRAEYKESEDCIRGSFIHIDRFGNLVSNISSRLIEEHRRGRGLRIITSRSRPIARLSQFYDDVSDGNVVALINSSGYLEIAINRSSGPEYNGASQLLGLYLRDPIEVAFT